MIVQSSKPELEKFARIASKLETFVRFVLRAEPSTQQLAFIRAVDAGDRFIAIKSGHGVGKSTSLAWVAIWWALIKEDAKIPITAPSTPQLLLTLMPEIRKWIAKLPKILRDEITPKSDEINFSNGNFIALRTARKETPEALQGFHAKHLLFLVDEASGVDETIFEIIFGALSGASNAMIMVGNPTRTSGFFYEAFKQALWHSFTFNAEQSANVAKEQIERARALYGRDSNAYRVRVLGEFPLQGSDNLFDLSALELAVGREIDRSGAVIWGLDPAEYGDDSSVLCKRKGFFIEPFCEFKKLDSAPLADAICAEYKKAAQKPNAIFIDVIGIGAGVWSILNAKGLPVYRADVREKSFKEGFYNKRYEIYARLKENIALLCLPRDEKLIGELGDIRYEIDENTGKIRLESKKKIRARLARSPDRADALALSFFDEMDFYEEETDGEFQTGDLLW